MNNTPNLNWLKEKVSQLQMLLEDPHPGLATWQNAYAHIIRELIDFWKD